MPAHVTKTGDRLMTSKTTLLKCIAELNVYDQGEILLRGK
jgi:ABC-type polar amino acid transport system ATPase subunit